MSDRQEEAFLHALAARLGRPRRSGVTPPDWGAHPAEAKAPTADREDLAQAFVSSLAALDTPVVRATRATFPDVLHGILAAVNCRSALYWKDERLEELGLTEILNRLDIRHRAWNPAESEQELRSFAAEADVGITFADMGLAETGTLVLFNGGGRGRLVSLLPPAYVAVLREADLVPRLTDAVKRIHERVSQGLPACINLITGPSRTGDIEMDLALGVHGPGTVRVILLSD